VPTMVRHKAAIRSGLMARGSALRMIPAAAQGKLSYRTLSISFPDACHI
jgi:lambda repressor-like predicted transcriptional regulator